MQMHRHRAGQGYTYNSPWAVAGGPKGRRARLPASKLRPLFGSLVLTTAVSRWPRTSGAPLRGCSRGLVGDQVHRALRSERLA